MSMTKLANLAKQRRVLAPKVSDSNTIKENHSKATLTMGELISSNKGTRQRDVFKKILEKPTCIKRGSKKRLVLVDEDDDIFQDMEPAGLEDDASEGYIVSQDDEYEDIDVIASANNDDEMRNDDPNKELQSLCQMFERTRKRTEGRAYVDTYDDTARKIEQMKSYKPPEDGSALVDPFTVVMNKDHDGYLRLYGRGVTKKMDSGEEPYMWGLGGGGGGGLWKHSKRALKLKKQSCLK